MPTPDPVPRLTPAERRHRRDRALALRQDGESFAAIGRTLGISPTRAHQLVLRARCQHWGTDLPGRLRNLLHTMGLDGRPEIEAAAVARLTRRELLGKANVGTNTAGAASAWLARHGLTLRGGSA
jgi:hypothetical protein